jgi:hypothetical protein
MQERVYDARLINVRFKMITSYMIVLVISGLILIAIQDI